MARKPIRLPAHRSEPSAARLLDLGRRAVAAGGLLAEAALAVAAARLLLRCRPLGRAQAALDRVGPARSRRPAPPPASIARAVAAAGRLFPGTQCLSRALATQAVLRRHGHRARLRIGFARAEARLLGHAWVEVDGQALAGEDAGEQWSALEPQAAAGPSRP